jgi:hypothetical protein
VYETNVASCRIWDALGFKRVGRVKGCGNLKSYSYPVDAIIYGRELNSTNPDDFISEERFEKIKYYLKHQKYPDGADRAEKSRLRSAATHYRLVIEVGVDGEEAKDKLFLKDKEVISDPQTQYEIARKIHLQHHGGINKTTASVAEKYHWVRIKETATLVIKNCPECFDSVRNNGGAAGNSPVDATQSDTLPASELLSEPAIDGRSNSTLGVSTQQHSLMSPNQQHTQNPIVLPGPIEPIDYQLPVDPRIMANLDAYGQYLPQSGDSIMGGHMEGQTDGTLKDPLGDELMDAAFGGRR